MMKKYKWYLILFNLLFLLVYFNWSVIKKEETLSNGKLVLLELAPIDPRSLMQGDYMRLNYAIANSREEQISAKAGYCVIRLNEHNVATKIRLQEKLLPLNEGEVLIKYKSNNNWSFQIGAESYFFEEGKAAKFDKAKYGGLKIDNGGNSILVGLYNDSFSLLNP